MFVLFCLGCVFLSILDILLPLIPLFSWESDIFYLIFSKEKQLQNTRINENALYENLL